MAEGRCIICRHEERQTIEYALRAGENLRVLGEKYGTSAPTLSRHHNRHMTERKDVARIGVVPPAPIVPVDTSKIDDPLMARVASSVGKLTQAMDGEFAAGRIKAALEASKEVRQWTELEARITGRMKDGGTTINIDQRKQVVKSYLSRSKAELDALIAERSSAIDAEVVVVTE